MYCAFHIMIKYYAEIMKWSWMGFIFYHPSPYPADIHITWYLLYIHNTHTVILLSTVCRSFDEASPRVKRSRVASSSSFPITNKIHTSSSPLPPTQYPTAAPSTSTTTAAKAANNNLHNFSFDDSLPKLPKVGDNYTSLRAQTSNNMLWQIRFWGLSIFTPICW